MNSFILKSIAAMALALAVQSVGLAPDALAQQKARDCSVRREPNGLIRGDRVPSGCVLQPEDRQDEAPARKPYISCDPRIFHTPNPKRSVLTNCARLSRGRMIIPSGAVISPERGGFGPVDRHFEPLDRHFGPLDRHFGPIQRHFGPLQRHFGRSRMEAARPQLVKTPPPKK